MFISPPVLGVKEKRHFCIQIENVLVEVITDLIKELFYPQIKIIHAMESHSTTEDPFAS